MRSKPFSAIRDHLPPSKFSDRSLCRPRPEDQAERQAADVANILKAAGIGAGGEESRHRSAVAVEHPPVGVDSQTSERKCDRRLYLQRVKRRVDDRLAGPRAWDFDR